MPTILLHERRSAAWRPELGRVEMPSVADPNTYVLVVDDDEQVRDDLVAFLGEAGHRVVAVPTISEGLACPPPAVVVHDVHLREGRFTEPVVAHYRHAGTVVIAFSGLPSDAPTSVDKAVSKSDFIGLIDVVDEAMRTALTGPPEEESRD